MAKTKYPEKFSQRVPGFLAGMGEALFYAAFLAGSDLLVGGMLHEQWDITSAGDKVATIVGLVAMNGLVGTYVAARSIMAYDFLKNGY